MAKKNLFKTIYSLPEILATNFQKFAKKPAMILGGDKKISYNDMRWDIFKTSNVLRVGGKTPKSVAIFIDDSPQAIESFYSVLTIGSKAALLRYDMSKEEVAAALKNEKPEAVFIRRICRNVFLPSTPCHLPRPSVPAQLLQKATF